MQRPDFFVTSTCNPKWLEITAPRDRPDLCSRVFLKLDELIKDLQDRGVLGTCKSMIHVVESQKRGLPHAHSCAILQAAGKLHSADII